MKTSAKYQGLWLCLAPPSVVAEHELPIPANDSSVMGFMAGEMKKENDDGNPSTAA